MFAANTAHSGGQYGLYVPAYAPNSQYPCAWRCGGDTTCGGGGGTAAPALLEGLVAYKNGRSGVLASMLGAVQFSNFRWVSLP